MYINKISSHYHWLAEDNIPMHEFPIPVNAENDYKRQLETEIPLTEEELKKNTRNRLDSDIDKQSGK